MSDERFPESAKMARASEQSQVIGEFLEWLQVGGTYLMRHEVLHDLISCHRLHANIDEIDDCGLCDLNGNKARTVEAWVNDSRSIETLLAEFFDVDLKAVERERRVMLAELRGAS